MTTTVWPCEHSRGTWAGAPATSSTASATFSSISSGRRAQSPLANSIALPRTQTRPVSTSMLFDRFDVQRRQRERDERRDAIADTESIFPRNAFPISSTRPTNIPPLPVTGLCCFPRSRTVSVMCSPISRGLRSHASAICRNDAESMLSTFNLAEYLVLAGDRRVVDSPRALAALRRPVRGRDAFRAGGAEFERSHANDDRHAAALERRGENDRGTGPRHSRRRFEPSEQLVEVWVERVTTLQTNSLRLRPSGLRRFPAFRRAVA